ncbi:unnamed protein product [Prorocentrum cordatum]|uniref:Uncharacterized protein n=1 Tax=Prorocentrum cordatum TaxID=2364126 RepID=A0ABN9WQ24_9DINO|nr:unnamed protein product [Polarella glacialis]CAK0887195.1 unnamed protein product [Polarella glacialis]
MQASAQAVLFLLFCCAAQPGSSVSVSERWPWSKKKNAQPAAAEAPMQKQYLAPGPAPAEDVLSELTQAGCYMRMPSGCPKAPMRTELWRHDAWAEKEGLDQEGCKSRKAVWDKYCDATDAQMAFVANQTRSPPLSALQISAGWTWPWSKRKAAPAAAEEKPAEAKAAETEAAVLAVDTESKVKSPTKPGCYMRMPSGCPKKPMQTQKWRHDTWAEQHSLDEAGCLQRGTVWNGFCGAEDAMMTFVVQQ